MRKIFANIASSWDLRFQAFCKSVVGLRKNGNNVYLKIVSIVKNVETKLDSGGINTLLAPCHFIVYTGLRKLQLVRNFFSISWPSWVIFVFFAH